MSEVQVRSREGGGFVLLVDGVDIANDVVEVGIRVTGRDAVVTLVMPARELDVELDDAEVATAEVATAEPSGLPGVMRW